MERMIPRRDLIRAGALITGGLFLGGINDTSFGIRVSGHENTAARKLIEASIFFREQIGLTGISAEAENALQLQNSDWAESMQPFQNRFPPSLRSYGDLAKYYSEVIFTVAQSSYLISGAEINLERPNRYAWNTSSRTLNLAPDAGLNYWTTYHPHGWSIQGFYGHEIAGHGTDPKWLWHHYPLEIFAQVERGKWRMLAQAFRVTGPLAENQSTWKLNDWLPFEIGEKTAKKYVETKQSLVSNDSLFTQFLDETAKVQKVEQDDVRFNRRVCRLLGRELLQRRDRRELQFLPELQATYQEALNGSLQEVYAEMMMALLINQNLINHNSEIIKGGQAILSAIRGDQVGIQFLREVSQRVPRRIEELHQEEQQQFLAPQPILEIAQADPIEYQVEKQYQGILEHGSSGLTSSLRLIKPDAELLAQYVDLVNLICIVYPELSDRSRTKSRDDFGPEKMHSWDARELNQAVNQTALRNILRKRVRDVESQLTDDDRITLIEGIPVMQRFVASDAFGT